MTQSIPIHAGRIQGKQKGATYLLLREEKDHTFSWYKLHKKGEEKTTLIAATVPEAVNQARKQWKDQAFRTLRCGMRYELPERDQCGTHALFHEMIQSYSTLTGSYFNADLNQMCIVEHASTEALHLWKRLAKEERL